MDAIDALRYYRRRTIVTLISLAWGVMCFLILISFGKGFEIALTKAFTAVGQDLIIMYGGQTSEQAGGLRSGRRVALRYSNATVLRDSVPMIGHISPEKMRFGVRIVRGTREKESTNPCGLA